MKGHTGLSQLDMKEAKHICNSIQPISNSVKQPTIALFFFFFFFFFLGGGGGGGFLIYNHDLQKVNVFSTNEFTLPLHVPIRTGLNKRNKYAN